MQHLPGVALLLKSKKAKLMRLLDVHFIVVFVSSFSPSGKLLERSASALLYLVYKRHQSLSFVSFSHLPALLIMHPRDSGHCPRVCLCCNCTNTFIIVGCLNILPDVFTIHFYRAMHFSAKRGIAIACRLSVRLSVCLSVCNVGEL